MRRIWTLGLVLAMCGGAFGDEPEEGLALLRPIPDLHEANLAKIDTWSGRASVLTRSSRGGETIETKNEATFFYRRSTDELASKWQVLSRAGDKEPPKRNVVSRNVVVTPDHFIEAIRYSDVRPRASIQPRSEYRRGGTIGGQWIDPMYFFANNASMRDRFKSLLHTNELADEDWNLEVTRWGDLVVARVEAVGPNLGLIINEYTVNLARGATYSRLLFISPPVETIYEIECEEVQGVWLPKRWEFSNTRFSRNANGDFDPTAPPLSKLERVVEWQENTLNKPIDDEVFTLANADIEPGTSIHDRVRGRYVRYDP